ncbi:MAG: LPS export ABC transporter periplasmic protein LptC [Syntrophales bacterium]|nr:LPS export ABC transporter periplasmic protein LptC [Syntrophales bacterium]
MISIEGLLNYVRGVILTKNKSRVVLVLVTVLVVSALAVFFLYKQREDVVTPEPLNGQYDVFFRDVVFTETVKGGSRWEVKAAVAKFLQKENVVSLEKVSAKLLMPDGGIYVLRGDEGKIFRETRDIFLKGNVLLTSDRGERITTDNVWYRVREKRILTDSPVKVDSEKVRIRGSGLIVDLARRSIVVKGNVKATVKSQ